MSLIPLGHTHYFVPISSEQSDFGLTIRSRCNDHYIQEDDGAVRRMLPGCMMEEERMFDREYRISNVRYRIGGIWMSAVDINRLLPVPVQVCPKCSGEPQPFRCEKCFGSGVVEESGGPIVAPNIIQS